MPVTNENDETTNIHRVSYQKFLNENVGKPVSMPANDASLVNLPVEILIKIFKYFPPYFLSRTMTLVCKRFALILNDDSLWKCLLVAAIKNKNKNNSIEVLHPFKRLLNENHWVSSRDILWRDLAVQFNILNYKWNTKKSEIKYRNFTQRHYAAVDALKIIGNSNIIVSGGRDLLINLWKIDVETLELEEVYTEGKTHGGWVWDIDSSSPDTFFSCGWDNYVSYWSFSNGVHKLSTFNCDKQVMAISCTRGLVAAGLHVPRIVLIDPRVGVTQQTAPKALISFNIHRHAITDVLLVPEKNLLLSISEDKTLSFFDLRHHSQCRKTITVTRTNSFPRCLGQCNDVLYIGDSRGNLHLYSLCDDNPLLQVFNIGTNTRLVTSIVPYMSGITTGSTDGYVRIFYPNDPPLLIWDHQMNAEVTSVDQDRNLLAVSTTSSSVSVFKALNV